MKVKNIKKVNITATLNNAVDTAKKSAEKANNFALNTTEDLVLETITIAGQWQKVTDTVLKNSVKLMANQQDLIFNTLEIFKSQLLDGQKKLRKVLS